jgi:hypothetical protein
MFAFMLPLLNQHQTQGLQCPLLLQQGDCHTSHLHYSMDHPEMPHGELFSVEKVLMAFVIVSVVLYMILTLLERMIFRLIIIFSSEKWAHGSGLASQTGIVFIIDRTSSIVKRRGPPSKSCARCWSNCE